MDESMLARLTVGCCSRLTADEMANVAEAGSIKTAPAGTKLLCEGETGDTLMILIAGSAEVTVSPGGETHHVADLGAGAVLGEVGLLRDVPRTATVTTKDETRYFALHRDAFVRMLDDPSSGAGKIVLALAQTLAERLSATHQSLRAALGQATRPTPEFAAFKETLLTQWDF